MAQVTVNIHKRPYQVACEDGQEQHVAKLAAYLDRKVTELAERSGLAGAAGQIAEARLLVMAALLVADELGDTYDDLEALRQAPPQMVADPASLKAADEARSIASAAKAQLAEAQTAARAAGARAGEADAARLAAEDALRQMEARATQAEATLQTAGGRAAELEAKLQAADSERAELRTAVAVFSVQKDGASAAEDALAAGLDSLAARIEGMAERLERAAAH